MDNRAPQEAFNHILEHREGFKYYSYQTQVITEVDIHQRIDAKVNKQVYKIHESYEARLCALKERLCPSNAHATVNKTIDILIFFESNHL